jgi:hypothetical protein
MTAADTSDSRERPTKALIAHHMLNLVYTCTSHALSTKGWLVTWNVHVVLGCGLICPLFNIVTVHLESFNYLYIS